jgi:hypothetical protein
VVVVNLGWQRIRARTSQPSASARRAALEHWQDDGRCDQGRVGLTVTET